MKPQKEIYALSCERLGVRPTAAFFIGDGGFAELPGARSAGMTPLQETWYRSQQIARPLQDRLKQVSPMSYVPAVLQSLWP
jgi:FMN phosphatase YigB (HAD superfamily)